MDINFRQVGTADQSFLYGVYAGTRWDELAVTDWNDKQKKDFLSMQFNAQHRYYQENYCGAEFLIILVNKLPVGRLYIARGADEIRIMDISLLPRHRNSGIGSCILKKLIAEAGDQRKPVRIHVERFNPAIKLYQRLGFVPIGENGVYYFMERPANPELC